jgi:hypothetical protein
MSRWVRTVAVVSLAALPFVAPGPARADPCPVLDPCTVDGVVDDTVDVISDTVGTATDTVDQARDTADEVLTGDTDQPAPDDGGRGGDHHAGGAGHRTDDEGTQTRKTRATDPRPFVPGARLAPRTEDAIGAPADAPIGFADEHSRDRHGTDRLIAGAAEVAKDIVTVLILLGAALGFVLIQDRLDRNEPRLALAPVRADDVRFE